MFDVFFLGNKMSSPERRKRNRKEESMLQREQSMIQASHLVVMQHGLHGTTNDFAHFERLFQQYFTQENVFVHCAKSNCQGIFQTYDGVDTGGERLAKEIQEISEKMPHLKKFSLIGHSLGGLYSRYAIGILYENGFFNKIQPMVSSIRYTLRVRYDVSSSL
jgi:triacylglycerol esterase/lipase EstA (alpha/beta hydrolase family)